MCGIAGFFVRDKTLGSEELRQMTGSLAHRGPDSFGYFTEGPVGLGHRRLSIIDLSSRANQPMTSFNGRYVIIYNGEVYNYREIGAVLNRQNIYPDNFRLRSSSDTEVILEGFNVYGPDIVNQLNGMFAFAIYDKEEKALYLFRDRLGIKPLYYYYDGETFAFASELKSLKAIPSIPFEINYKSLQQFLHLGYIPTPNTCYRNIYKMPSGTWIKVTTEGIQINKYYDLKSKLTANIITDKSQALVMLSDLLTSSVQYQMKSDVPFGVFLSGGVDSSLIAAQATIMSGLKVKTFSIGFEELSHNESIYAKAVASYLDTDHHEFIVSVRDAMGLVERMLTWYDEPFGDSSAIPTMLISRLARNYVTVTLSGEGGDELFFGYGFYKWAKRLSHPLFRLGHKPLSKILSHFSSRYQRVSRLLDYDSTTFLPGHIYSQEQYYFSVKEIKQYSPLVTEGNFEDDIMFEINRMLSMTAGSFYSGPMDVSERVLNPIEIQSLFDLQFYLQDDLLAKVDRASMIYSLETRVPYLDHRVVEAAINVSTKLKYHHGTAKYILKEILYKYLPKKLFQRPKQGFAIPLNKWLKNEMRYLIDEYLSDRVVRKHGIINSEYVETLVKAYMTGTEYYFNRIWLLIVLHHWLENHTKKVQLTADQPAFIAN